MSKVSCPTCGVAFAVVETLKSAMVLKGQCPNPVCRRRLTVLDHLDNLTDQWSVRVIHSPGDLKRDKEDPYVGMESKSTPELLTLIEALDDAADTYLRAHDQQLHKLRRYYNERKHRETELARVNKRLKDETASAVKSRFKVAVGGVDKLTGEQDLLRRTLVVQLEKYVARGKIPPERAEVLLKRSVLSKGLAELADALGVPTWMD